MPRRSAADRMSAWREPIDQGPGRLPLIRATGEGDDLTYELAIQGGVMATELFIPWPQTRLVLRCHDDGAIDSSITYAPGWQEWRATHTGATSS